jgi:opacity protein-like surface antigen
MKRFAVPVCVAAALAAGSAVPAHSAEHGWYVGTGIGYSKGQVPGDAVNNLNTTLNATIPGSSVTTIIKGDDSLMYQLFLGYSFTSFLALEASAFRLGDFNFNSTISVPGNSVNARSTLDMWGGSVDILGIIPLGDAWRVYGRVGAILVQSEAKYYLSAEGLNLPTVPSDTETKWGWKAGAGVGYEFESGVAFRAEYNYYRVDTAWGTDVSTQVFSGTALYRFK